MAEIKASDCKCCKCKEPAVAFWPCVDPDIRSYPYCDKCLNKARVELMIAFAEMDGQKIKKRKK